MDARLVVDPPRLGAWNMAADELLLERASEHDEVSLRLYQWSEPTLSLGYFQPYDERQGHLASKTCPLVRRASGGGAIVHDRELTYSLAVPTRVSWAREPRALYQLIHQAIVEILAGQGVRAELAAQSVALCPEHSEPFLCFERRGEGDVLFQGRKVCGSAQRRHRYALLQHGSILLAAAAAAPELPGLGDLVGRTFNPTHLGEQLWTRVGQLLELKWKNGPYTGAEQGRIESLCVEKFAADHWTYRR